MSFTKNKIINTFKSVVLLTIPTITLVLILLEVFFRTVIPASNPPRSYFNEKEKLYQYSNKIETGVITIGKFAEFRIKWHINNMGWNYPIDYFSVKDKKLIAVIGDSYVEAMNVDVTKNYPYLLRGMLSADYEVYAFGKSGDPLSQYLHISRYVREHYNPDIIIFNIIHNDFDESIRKLNPIRSYFLQVAINEDGSIKELAPTVDQPIAQYLPRWQKVIYRSAFVRYIYQNLKVSQIIRKYFVSIHKPVEANIRVEDIKKNQYAISTATKYLVTTIREENPNKRIIFIFDAPREAIYSNSLSESQVGWLYELMDSVCAENNVEYINLTPRMTRDYQVNNKRFNSTIDSHWNEYGHEFVATVLYEYLTNTKQKD